MRRYATLLAVALWLQLETAAVADTTIEHDAGVEIIVTQRDGPSARTTRREPTGIIHARKAASRPDAQRLLDVALGLLGVRYLWGGASPAGFDCSGYTWYAFARLGIAIPRTANLQFDGGRAVSGSPLPGDLVFFQTYDYGASHVGIYLGDGRFINAIGSDVHVASFASPYFSGRYLGARRFLPG